MAAYNIFIITHQIILNIYVSFLLKINSALYKTCIFNVFNGHISQSYENKFLKFIFSARVFRRRLRASRRGDIRVLRQQFRQTTRHNYRQSC
jgi:hypothetical protein